MLPNAAHANSPAAAAAALRKAAIPSLLFPEDPSVQIRSPGAQTKPAGTPALMNPPHGYAPSNPAHSRLSQSAAEYHHMPPNDPPWKSLPPFDRDSGLLNVIVETTQGSRNKLKYDEARRMFRLNTVLPAGEAFPYGFGFVPGTKGQDGDPVDALVLMDTPTFPGCLV